MVWLILVLFTWLRSCVRSRSDLGLEIVALRQQLIVLKRGTKRPRLRYSDRLFWVTLAPTVAKLAQTATDRKAGHRSALASERLPFVLALSVSKQAGR